MFSRRTSEGQLTWLGKTVRSMGFGRLLYHCYTRPIKAAKNLLMPNRPVEIDIFGYKLKLPPPRSNFCFTQIYTKRIWEAEVTEEVRRRVKPGMNVADVGADIGYYVLLFATLNKGGAIWAFEPNPVNFPYLTDTVRLNNLSNVSLFQFGLGDVNTQVTFSVETSQTNLANQSEQTSSGSFTTDIKVFDEVLATIATPAPKLDFLLMDVEGAEMNVLVGMQETIQRDRPTLLIELHGPMLPQFGYSKSGLIEWLRNRGYSAHWVAGEAIEDPGYTHAVFVHDTIK